MRDVPKCTHQRVNHSRIQYKMQPNQVANGTIVSAFQVEIKCVMVVLEMVMKFLEKEILVQE